jgi:hypothetical protein
MIILTSGAIPMTVTGIRALTGFIYLFWHIIPLYGKTGPLFLLP